MITGPAPVQAAKPAIVVVPLKSKSVKGEALAAISDAVVYAVSKHGTYRVITKDDLDAELSREHLKDVMGCDAIKCAAEIGGALGARYLLTGSVRTLGRKITVNLSLIDTERRNTKRGKGKGKNDIEAFEEVAAHAVRDLLGVGHPSAPETGPTAPSAKVNPAAEAVSPEPALGPGPACGSDAACLEAKKALESLEPEFQAWVAFTTSAPSVDGVLANLQTKTDQMQKLANRYAKIDGHIDYQIGGMYRIVTMGRHLATALQKLQCPEEISKAKKCPAFAEAMMKQSSPIMSASKDGLKKILAKAQKAGVADTNPWALRAKTALDLLKLKK